MSNLVSLSLAVCSEEFHHAPKLVKRVLGISLALAISAWMTSPGGILPSVPPCLSSRPLLPVTVADESVELTMDSRREEVVDELVVRVELGSCSVAVVVVVMVRYEREDAGRL